MRVFLVAAMIAALTLPAFAQQKKDPTPTEIAIEAEKKRYEQIDREYRATLERTRNQNKTQYDPWGTVRGPEPAKAPVKRQKKAN